MPQLLKSFTPQRKPSPGAEPKYPWDDWFGQIAKLKPGQALRLNPKEDFDCNVKTISNLFHRQCLIREIDLIVFRDGDSVVVQKPPKGYRDRPKSAVTLRHAKAKARRSLPPKKHEPPAPETQPSH